MNQKTGRKVEDCPLDLDVCYPSCAYWKGRCCHDEIMAEHHHTVPKEPK